MSLNITFSNAHIMSVLNTLNAYINKRVSLQEILSSFTVPGEEISYNLYLELEPPRLNVYINGYYDETNQVYGAGDTTCFSCMLNAGDTEESLMINRIYIEGPLS